MAARVSTVTIKRQAQWRTCDPSLGVSRLQPVHGGGGCCEVMHIAVQCCTLFNGHGAHARYNAPACQVALLWPHVKCICNPQRASHKCTPAAEMRWVLSGCLLLAPCRIHGGNASSYWLKLPVSCVWVESDVLMCDQMPTPTCHVMPPSGWSVGHLKVHVVVPYRPGLTLSGDRATVMSASHSESRSH
jgi:hypothetical protein